MVAGLAINAVSILVSSLIGVVVNRKIDKKLAEGVLSMISLIAII